MLQRIYELSTHSIPDFYFFIKASGNNNTFLCNKLQGLDGFSMCFNLPGESDISPTKNILDDIFSFALNLLFAEFALIYLFEDLMKRVTGKIHFIINNIEQVINLIKTTHPYAKHCALSFAIFMTEVD